VIFCHLRAYLLPIDDSKQAQREESCGREHFDFAKLFAKSAILYRSEYFEPYHSAKEFRSLKNSLGERFGTLGRIISPIDQLENVKSVEPQ
jgi:hypothetical protein